MCLLKRTQGTRLDCVKTCRTHYDRACLGIALQTVKSTFFFLCVLLYLSLSLSFPSHFFPAYFIADFQFAFAFSLQKTSTTVSL